MVQEPQSEAEVVKTEEFGDRELSEIELKALHPEQLARYIEARRAYFQGREELKKFYQGLWEHSQAKETPPESLPTKEDADFVASVYEATYVDWLIRQADQACKEHDKSLWGRIERIRRGEALPEDFPPKYRSLIERPGKKPELSGPRPRSGPRQRESVKLEGAVCAGCGTENPEVSPRFRWEDPGRPVYCLECWPKYRPQRTTFGQSFQEGLQQLSAQIKELDSRVNALAGASAKKGQAPPKGKRTGQSRAQATEK